MNTDGTQALDGQSRLNRFHVIGYNRTDQPIHVRGKPLLSHGTNFRKYQIIYEVQEKKTRKQRNRTYGGKKLEQRCNNFRSSNDRTFSTLYFLIKSDLIRFVNLKFGKFSKLIHETPCKKTTLFWARFYYTKLKLLHMIEAILLSLQFSSLSSTVRSSTYRHYTNFFAILWRPRMLLR